MSFKISFECSQALTEAQMAKFRTAIEQCASEVVADIMADNAGCIDDVPEWFFTALTQEEVEE
jgi:cytochrome P450